MPFKSKAQRGFMHAKHPEIADKWDKEGGTPKDIPEHVGDKRKKRSKSRRRK